MTFSCPHFDIARDACWRLKVDCVPGRPGCVLRHNSTFAVPVEERLAEKAPLPPPVKTKATKKPRRAS